MRSHEDAIELIEPLIEGMTEDPLWSTFLDRLRLKTQADYVSLIFRPSRYAPPERRIIHLYSGQASPPAPSRLYRESLHMADPVPYYQLAEGHVYDLAELMQFDDPAHEDYRQRFLMPSGMNIQRMMRVVEPSGVNAWLTITRREIDFEPRHDALLADLGPFLRAALRSYVALERERTAASVAGEAIRRMNFGWLTLDADGRVLDADPGSSRLLEESGMLLKGKDGKLTARVPEVGQEIMAAIRALSGDPGARPRAVVLCREPWLDMLLVGTSGDQAAARPSPAIFAYVHADNWSSADRCDQLAQLFDLVPSEARLALALSRGMSITDAAGELGLTVESARTYSKRIYAKTGARGQADLVRFIHRSVLAIA